MKKLKTLLMVTCFSLIFSIQSFAGWVQQDGGQWKYDQDGTMVTSQWIEDEGSWYYLNENGVMLANITQKIDGTDYTFDASGKWLDPNAIVTPDYNTYTNTDFGYSLQVPSNMTTTINTYDITETYEFSYQDISITFFNVSIPSDKDPGIFVDCYKSQLENSYNEMGYPQSRTYTTLGELSVYKAHYCDNDGYNIDLYTYAQDYKMIAICVGYTDDKQAATQEILNTLKKVS